MVLLLTSLEIVCAASASSSLSQTILASYYTATGSASLRFIDNRRVQQSLQGILGFTNTNIPKMLRDKACNKECPYNGVDYIARMSVVLQMTCKTSDWLPYLGSCGASSFVESVVQVIKLLFEFLSCTFRLKQK